MGPNIKSGKPDLMLATRVVGLTSQESHCKAERNGSHNRKKSAKSFEMGKHFVKLCLTKCGENFFKSFPQRIP